MEAMRTRHETEKSEIQKAAQKEVSELVKKSNKKYNEMLAERMAKEDELQQEIDCLYSLLKDEIFTSKQ
ncbi:hypothetical protein CYMTET_39847 [Cymbomonas tetramitiformis]|uniref:Uncharacterized protein n=1 Tax=Cymbomonas tetramitiformis TaxID=36881 RepID=A0AAE0C9B7_9CHLO|nr:hypothetical protein CYMTET_39847 [Cymbomonas tetramitiformis]